MRGSSISHKILFMRSTISHYSNLRRKNVWRKEKERNTQQNDGEKTSESKEQRRERRDRRNELDRAKRAAETDEQKKERCKKRREREKAKRMICSEQSEENKEQNQFLLSPSQRMRKYPDQSTTS